MIYSAISSKQRENNINECMKPVTKKHRINQTSPFSLMEPVLLLVVMARLRRHDVP